MKIAVCVPHTGSLKAETARCLGDMLVYTAQAQFTYNGRPDRAEIELLFGGHGPLDWKRTDLAFSALRRGSDYLLWIDSDQTFAPDALVRLMAHDKAIVAANYPSRRSQRPTALDFDSNPVARRQGLEPVGAVGFGFCLMKTPLLEQVPKPWFTTVIGEDGACLCGEDVHFCNQARSAGILVHVDHDLEVGHIADQVLTLDRDERGQPEGES